MKCNRRTVYFHQTFHTKKTIQYKMASNVDRDKIFKLWSGISELALIKEVATKGEHIDLCISYWARKRKMPVSDYEFFFHDIVQTYVTRLLNERLVCKAEIVLRNVHRDVKCFYYQFACECNDPELRELLMDHLQKKYPQNFESDMQDLQFHWSLLEKLRKSDVIMADVKKHMKRINLEALMALDTATKQHILISLYFENRNENLLQHINKFVMWNFLIETKQVDEIISWLSRQSDQKLNKVAQPSLSALEDKYAEWAIEPEMYEYAIRSLPNSNDDVLRNLFADAGYFFPDERNNVETVIQRICVSNSLDRNRDYIKSLPIGRYIYERSFYHLLLNDFVTVRQLEEMSEEINDNSDLLNLIIALKSYKPDNLDGLKKINHYASKYIQHTNDCDDNLTLATLFEFLANQQCLANMQCSITSGIFKSLTYLKVVLYHENNHAAVNPQSIPTIYDLVKTFKGIDVNRLCKDANTFSKISVGDGATNKNNHRLNFVHYIKQSRSAYAVYLMLVEQLQNYAQITKTHLLTTCESVYELALQTPINDFDVISHCIAFCEMLGFDTQQLRCVLRLRQYLQSASYPNVCPDRKGFNSIINEAERLLTERLTIEDDTQIFPINEYSTIMACKSICPNTSSKDNVSQIMQRYAAHNDYWHLLVLVHYFEIPLEQIKCLVKYFNIPPIGDHLLRALSTLLNSNSDGTTIKRRSSITKRQLHSNRQKKSAGDRRAINTSVETMTSSMTSGNDILGTPNGMTAQNKHVFADCSIGSPDIFALILLNMDSSNSCNETSSGDVATFLEHLQNVNANNRDSACAIVKFLRTSIDQRLPIMAVLAASIAVGETKFTHLEWCWLVWLAVTTDQWNNVLRFGNSPQEFPWNLMDHLVSQNQITAIVRSFEIFFPHNGLIHLFRFLQLSTQNEFSDANVHELRLYCLAWSNEEIRLPLNFRPQREKLMKRTIRLLLLHTQSNFESAVDQLKFLSCVCKSGLSDITGQLDFCLLKQFCEILMTVNVSMAQRFPLNFIQLLQAEQSDVKEYERILKCVLAAREYDTAVRLASLLHKPISNIIYSKWVTSLESQLDVPSPAKFDNYKFPFDQYENEVSVHSMPPETLVNFLLHASAHLPEDAPKSRYTVLQKALNVIKHHHLFPNESFDRDQIEYDMIVNYLMLEDATTADLTLYHSEYYEEIMLSERRVLYKTFLELKELAGIEDLNISNKIELNEIQVKRLESLLHRLLDEGDIVEALRLQELFDIRPLDLRFIVFCMALAESMSTVYCMSADERQLLSEIERSSFSKFTKRTLCSAGGGGAAAYLSDSCSTLEFEEIPSKEKQETLTILQGIASKLKYGINIARRIISCYRAAMYLDKEYVDVLRTKDVHILLQSIAEEGCLHRLLVVSDILTSTHMEPKEIAELLAFEISTAIVRPRFYIFSPDQQAKSSFRNADLWGYNIDRDLHLFLELTPDRTQLGACLLEYCDALKAYRKYQDNKPYNANIYFDRLAEIIARYGLPNNSGNINSINASEIISPISSQPHPPQVLSHKKQNIIYVELLIKAHQAFVHECSMEGIANVLNRAKALNSILAQAKSWSLIVRMLTGIARYREMYFCFDTLIENEQFESLLGQFDEEKTIGLRQAILAYLREYCAPQQGKELFKLAALHFLMYKDLAELWEQDAEEIQVNVNNTASLTDDGDIKKLRCTPDITNQLNKSLEYYVHAAENYLQDNKLLLAQKSAAKAELTAMQIDLVTKALEKPPAPSGNYLCPCVIQLKSRQQFKNLVNDELSVPQALILSRAYGYDINWSEALLSQYIIQVNNSYFIDFLQQIDITDDIIENVVKGFQVYSKQNLITKRMDENIAQLIEMASSLTLKYKLASLLTLKSTILSLINSDSIHYLRDMKFGRREEHRNT
ncbi:spatacsin [Musca autumnalis]|uniref:spatacsin n=1 Tax=Musca autumnalis TaxID=221902 RepID=UPI003CF270A5